MPQSYHASESFFRNAKQDNWDAEIVDFPASSTILSTDNWWTPGMDLLLCNPSRVWQAGDRLDRWLSRLFTHIRRSCGWLLNDEGDELKHSGVLKGNY